MRPYRLIGFIVSLVAFAGLLGCGGKTTTMCKITGFRVSPATATVSHTAAPPANTQHFDAFQTSAPAGCGFALSNLTTATWTVSDTVNVSIGATSSDPAFGTATCKNATAGAVTVTATVPVGDGTNLTNTASLTCN